MKLGLNMHKAYINFYYKCFFAVAGIALFIMPILSKGNILLPQDIENIKPGHIYTCNSKKNVFVFYEFYHARNDNENINENKIKRCTLKAYQKHSFLGYTRWRKTHHRKSTKKPLSCKQNLQQIFTDYEDCFEESSKMRKELDY